MGITSSQPPVDNDTPPTYPPYFQRIHLSTPNPPLPPPWESPNPPSASPDDAPADPIAHLIDFPSSPLASSYNSHLALVIDNIFTPAECASLIALAESGGPWVAASIDNQLVIKDYRNSDRVLRNDSVAAGWIFERVRPWLEELGLGVLYEPREDAGAGQEKVQGEEKKEGEEAVGTRGGGEKRWPHIVSRRTILRPAKKGAAAKQLPEPEPVVRWELSGLNSMLRFLKYEPGQFFDRHCDSSFTNSSLPTWDATQPLERSFITIQLYLASPGVGGATGFWGKGKDFRTGFEVEARRGRVLVFQQKDLVHTGEKVEGGEKVTVRSEFMYRRVVEGESEAGGKR